MSMSRSSRRRRGRAARQGRVARSWATRSRRRTRAYAHVRKGPWLAKRSERLADVFGEQLGLLPGREVPAPVVLVVGDEVGIRLLGPAARDPVDLVGEGAQADGDLDALDRDGGELALPV